MKELFKNTTTYTLAVYQEFLAFHRKKFKLTYFLFTLFVIGFFSFSMVMQLSYQNYFLLFILFCIVIVFLLWRYLHPISVIKKELNSDKIKQEKSFIFCFYDKFFTVSDKEKTNSYKYKALYRIYETPTFFYLYIDRTHAFLLSKEKFIRNKQDKFSDFIKNKQFLKYRKSK